MKVDQLTSFLIAEAKNIGVTEAIAKVDTYLSRRKLRHLWPVIDSELARKQKQNQVADRTSVTSAVETEDQATLDYYHKITAKPASPEIKKSIETDLLGGTIIESNDTRLDLTIKKQLQKLHHTLTK